MEQLLWHLLAGTRGGANRLRIIQELLHEPMNAQRLANRLGLDYRTVRHHLSILTKNGLLARPEAGAYGARLCVSRVLLVHIETVERINRSVNRQTSEPGSSGRPHQGATGGD